MSTARTATLPRSSRGIRHLLHELMSTVRLRFFIPHHIHCLKATGLTIRLTAYPNGASSLLVHLTGTIPTLFRGNTYRFPVSIWVPHAYPREAPLAYVTPTETMMVRPGQHVDPQGQVYHPYLAGWGDFWDVSHTAPLIGFMCSPLSQVNK